MKQILVASDFSQSASDATVYALSLAKALKMEVAVLHAIHPTEGINNNPYNAIFIEEYYSRKRKALQEWVDSLMTDDLRQVKVKVLCDVGSLRTVINRHVEYHNVFFLVMGITGATGITGIVGSNASMAVSKLRIPTLIVPRDTKLSAAPVITLATDYKTTKLSIRDIKAMKQLMRIAAGHRLEALHVTEDDTDPKDLEHEENRLRSIIPTADFHFNYINGDEKTSKEIIDFIKGNQTDILCLVKRNHNIIYSLFGDGTVSAILNKSVNAVLILHE